MVQSVYVSYFGFFFLLNKIEDYGYQFLISNYVF